MSKANGSKRVLVTRQFEQVGSFVNSLSARGHYPFLLPMIETSQLCPIIDDGIYEVILFTSANAVKYFTPYNERVRGLVYIAVGPKTAHAMQVYLGVSADRIPIVYDLEHVKKILATIKLDGARILSPGAKARTEMQLDDLLQFGASISTPAVYETTFAEYPKGFIDQFIDDNKINVVTFCSPSSAKSFLSQSVIAADKYEIVSIGSTTADYLESIGITSRYPETFTVESMVEII